MTNQPERQLIDVVVKMLNTYKALSATRQHQTLSREDEEKYFYYKSVLEGLI